MSNPNPNPDPDPDQVSNLGGVGPDTNPSEQWLYYENIGSLYGGQVDLLYLLWLPYLPGRPEGRGRQLLTYSGYTD